MNAQECDAAAAKSFDGGVEAFAQRILSYPDCAIIEPRKVSKTAGDNPAECAGLPEIPDETLRTQLAALGGHPELIAQIDQSLLYEWNNLDNKLDGRQFQRLLDNRMTTLGAVAGGQADAARHRRTDDNLTDVITDNSQRLQTGSAIMTASFIAAGGMQLNPDATDTLEPFIVDGTVDWDEVLNNPDTFATVIEGTKIVLPEASLDLREGRDNFGVAMDWAGGTE